nr:Zinc finger C2CH type [Hymenolepis microstoma]
MPTTCGFPNCKFRSRYKGFEDNRHFYRVPKKPTALRAKWLEAIGRTEANIVSQLRICSGHFHGGEKKEGDIPVADPAIDPPKRIELPSKNQRLPVGPSSSFVRNYHRGGSSNASRFRGRGRGSLSLKLIPPRFLSPLPPPNLLTSAQNLTPMEVSMLDMNQDALMNVWNMLLNGPPYLPPLSTILQTIPQNAMLPSTATATAQPIDLSCVRSSALVIFDRCPAHLTDIPEIKCCKSVVKNVVVISKLDELWLYPEIPQTTIVIVFYDMSLFNKDTLRHFKNLQFVVLADTLGNSIEDAVDYLGRNGILHKIILPQPDIDIAADLIFSMILQVNYKVTSIQAYHNDHTSRAESVHFTRNLREKIIGIIGLDTIGLAVARRCAVFGLKVVIYDPTVPEGMCSGFGFEKVDYLEKLLPLCDFLTFHSGWLEMDFISQIDISGHRVGLIRKDASLICLTNRVNFDYLALTRSLNQGNIKSVVLTKKHITNLLSLHTSISEDTRSLPSIHEINPSKLITKESLITHRQNVSEFVLSFLNELVRQPTRMQKLTSGENQCPNNSIKSEVIGKKQIQIYQEGSESKGKEPKDLNYNRMLFSIDTLVKSGKDPERIS